MLAGQISQALIVNNPLLLGDANLTFCPPGNPACSPASGNSVHIDVQLDLSLFPYLKFDWDGDDLIDDPTATATFGIYLGNPVNIYIQQVYQ